MQTKTFTFKNQPGLEIFVYNWLPASKKKTYGVVQILHGMAEHAGRYERFAEQLTNAGFIVYAHDHFGHGKTAGKVENLGNGNGKKIFFSMIEDSHFLTEIIKKENPGLPVILFSHSMGSFIAQGYISKYGRELKAAVLSGTAGKTGPVIYAGILLSSIESKIRGRNALSDLMNQMSFGSYNNYFKPIRTNFDWLSRDKAEVDKYIQDPFCGTVFSAGFFHDLLMGLSWIHSKPVMKSIPAELPLLIFSGSHDPVGSNTKSVKWLINEYKKIGIKDLTSRFFDGGRHEMLNETNRDEVMAYTIDWMLSRLS